MELEKILPKNGPSILEVKKYIDKYKNEVIIIKCGGSVLLDKSLFKQFIEDISVINKLGLSSIVVHGGGKNIYVFSIIFNCNFSSFPFRISYLLDDK